MKRILFTVTMIFILIFSAETFSWWSAVIFRESTHHKLMTKAIEQIDGGAYPDIKRFGNSIADWTSGPSDDANAHGKKYENEYGEKAGKFNGGPYEFWWQHPTKPDGVLIQYKLHNYVNGDYSAYYYLAMMAHLIADQAVPAHASNILHGFPNTLLDADSLEKQSYNEAPQQSGTQIMPGINYYYYFEDTTAVPKIIYGSIDKTQTKLLDWKSLDGKRYWLENDDTKYIGKAFDSIWGKYGGDNAKDIYDEEKDTSNIIQSQFLQGAAYMAGFLRTASEKLPPLVSDLALDTLQINSGAGTVIAFYVEENRMPNIKIKITVDDKAIKTTEGVWDGTTESFLIWNANLTELPYHGALSVKWEGLLSDGNYLSDGQHSIVVSVQDADGNWSNESAKDITFNQTIQILKGRRPTFIATMDEEIEKSSLKMIIDGVAYSPFTYDFNIGKMVYKPTFDLEYGLHQCKIIGTDTAGNTIEGPTCTIKTEPTKIVIEDLDLSPRVTNGTTPLILKFKAKIK